MARRLADELLKTRNVATLAVIALSVPCWLCGVWYAGLALNSLAVILTIQD